MTALVSTKPANAAKMASECLRIGRLLHDLSQQQVFSQAIRQNGETAQQIIPHSGMSGSSGRIIAAGAMVHCPILAFSSGGGWASKNGKAPKPQENGDERYLPFGRPTVRRLPNPGVAWGGDLMDLCVDCLTRENPDWLARYRMGSAALVLYGVSVFLLPDSEAGFVLQGVFFLFAFPWIVRPLFAASRPIVP